MKGIVLSGFEVFGAYAANATETLVRQLDSSTCAGFWVWGRIFEASIPLVNRGKELLALAQRTKAAAIVSLGMASEKTGLCVEARAVNKISHSKYVSHALNHTPICGDRPYEEGILADLAPWNIEEFHSRCDTEDIPVMDISMDAGGFCCNHLMYQVLEARRREEVFSRIPFIFLHVPCSPQAVPDMATFIRSGKTAMSISKMHQGLEWLLENAHL